MSTEIARQDERKSVQRVDPMEMIQRAFDAAIQQGAALDVIDRILAQQREVIDYNDRTAFNAALRRIQDKLQPIVKDATNPETRSRYASAGAVDNAIESLLKEEGMALTFEPEAHPLPDMLRIVGVLSLGAYARRYPLDVPADGKGAKGGGVMSRTHATGSAITYGKRYLKNMIFNLRFTEKDDDGNAAGGGEHEPIEETEFVSLLEKIQGAKSQDALKTAFFDGVKIAKEHGDQAALKSFEKAKNEAWRSNGGFKQ